MDTKSYHFSSEILIKTNPLPKSMISHKTKHTATATATAIEPLSALLKRHKKHLEYNVMEQLIECIGRQLQSLERENKGISSFNLDDITVFHNATTAPPAPPAPPAVYFAITNDEKIHEINEDNNLVINTPYSTSTIKEKNTRSAPPPFHSPEFKEFIAKKTLPYEIHFKSGYYSFGLLCMYCYLSRSAAATTAATTATATSTTATTATTATTTATTTLDTVVNTKIYWFLKQMLQENPTERRYICA
jgi:hypothetical protein